MTLWPNIKQIIILLVLLITGCQQKQLEEKINDPLLAEVYKYKLYFSEIEELVTSTESEKDSLVRLHILVDNWVREKLLLHQAENITAPDLDIEKLLADYRSSLLVHNYEKILIQDQIDTTVSKQELNDYYEKNMDQYQLESTIIRCYLIKTKSENAMKEKLEEWWDSEKSEDFKKLVEYCNKNAELFILDSTQWYKVEEVTQLLPAGSLSESSMQENRDYKFSNETHTYYLRILESVKNKEIAPLSYIEEQATRYIMHQRKLTLLEQIKNDIYEEGLKSRFVKINVE